MLSSTHTIADVKNRLGNSYTYFGFTTDSLFTAALTMVATDIELLFFYPRIGSTEYTRIQALNKVGLTETETYIYWAEVYTICAEFLKSQTAKTTQMQNSSNERLTVEGYTYQTSSSGGSSSGERSFKHYFDKAFSFWKLAGYNVMVLERTCTIFGGSQLEDDLTL